ncbi:hypothetical protein [Algoriphagus sp. A40]|uniref:hypothetical protein n=1 Tax=Algoriphagus sp. A40 TaxID=1945863 RepID=UPI000986713C|nr:hypothetical protein [Algoriphagus sp. A40]OOG76426.1 hypothetical protein B0E43_08015 [Algoriphagus sp. A40]
MSRLNNYLKAISVSFLLTSSINAHSQESITLYGEQPLQFTSTGTGLYTKSAIYNAPSYGLLIDLVKKSDVPSGIPIDFEIDARGGGHNFLFIKGSTGNIGIGTANPSYKLDVIGTIRAREVKVDMSGADFVFEKDYGLMPLEELEVFINAKKHLPEIETAAEMQAEGVELGELNTKLLQKIEELTLYVIGLKKEIEELKSNQKN